MGIKQWILPHIQPGALERMTAETGYPELVGQVLLARGCDSGEAVKTAFGSGLKLDDPYLLKDMDKAVARIRQALEDGEKIAVYGDYDCDGVTSTALLSSYLQSVGADMFYYIPDREREGYGLNMEAVDLLHQQGVQLIITVDNGVSSHEEIARAGELGMDVVVTDHHTPRDTLPQAVAVVNPHRSDCPSTFKELAGVGVTFKLVCALEDEDGTELMEYYSDLAMLGTVADVVSLTGENRLLVQHGLAHLADTERPGLRALISVSGMEGRALTSESVAFGLIPRINAAGRMGSVDDAVELLLTDDVPYAAELAQGINELNQQRKEIENGILAQLEKTISDHPELLDQRVLVLSGKGWHHGVVGIVAAKIVERYGKPAILFSIDKGEARGSGRSVEGFSLIQAITSCKRLLTRYGGHTLAAGLTLPEESLPEFTNLLQAYASEFHPVMPLPSIPVDCVSRPGDLTPEQVGALAVLEPFGADNRPPLFLLPDMTIEGIYPTSDKKHIRLRLMGEGTALYAVYFRMSQDQFPYEVGDKVDLVANISLGEYNGKPQVSVKIKDLRMSGIPQEDILADRERYTRHLAGQYLEGDRDALTPDRDDFAALYKYLRRIGRFGHSVTELYYRLMGTGMGYGKMRVALDVLEEMGLIARDDGVRVLPAQSKVDMDTSRILTGLRV